jgi:hypothetical protein
MVARSLLNDWHRGTGSRLYPAMPYTATMSRDDVLAIRACLNMVTQVRNNVVANILPFPFNICASMLVSNAPYFSQGDHRMLMRERH